MSLGNLRSLGVRAIALACDCGHEGTVVVDELPDEMAVPDVRLRCRCGRCGKRPRSSMPDWTDYAATRRKAEGAR